MPEEYGNRLISHYQKALQIKPDSLAANSRLAEAYYTEKKLEKSFEVWQRYLKTLPDSVLLIPAFSEMMKKLGFEKEDSEIYQKLLQKESDLTAFFQAFWNKLSHSESPDTATATTWKDAMILGFRLEKEKHWDEAIAAYMKAIEMEPGFSLSQYALYQMMTYHTSLQAEQLNKIVDFYRSISQQHSIYGFLHFMLGNILTQQGNLAEAIASYRNAIYQDPYLTEKLPQEYRSPQNKTSSVNFLIIGVGKSGTTSLYNYMRLHPKIIPSLQKEIHFFNLKFDLGLDWYLSHFAALPPDGSFLTGEATPWYLGSQGAETRVFSSFPKAKLIVVLRDPIARAISHYHMNCRMTEERSLEAALNSEIAILSNVTDFAQLSEKYWQTEQGYLWFGLYAYFLKKWMALFPREQFLILRSEELYSQTADTLKQVFEFLGLPDYQLSEYPKYNSGSYPQINDNLRQQLSHFFSPHNQQLEDLLGQKFDWQ